MQEHESTRVSDVHLAAYLVAKGFSIVRVEGQLSPRESVQAIVGFDNGEPVSARALLDALRNLCRLLVQSLR